MESRELAALIESGKDRVITMDGLRVQWWAGQGVLNVMEQNQTLTRPRLDQFRAALKEVGYNEGESWVATQGASWLCDGLFAGVSMRIRKVG